MEEVWIELPRDWKMRVIEVGKLTVGDVVHIGREPQAVLEIGAYDDERVLLRLSGEEKAKPVMKTFLYKLVALSHELEEQEGDGRP